MLQYALNKSFEEMQTVLAETLDWCWSGKIKIERKWYYDI